MNDLFKQAEWQEGSDSQLQHIIDAVNGPGMRDLGYLINEFRCFSGADNFSHLL